MEVRNIFMTKEYKIADAEKICILQKLARQGQPPIPSNTNSGRERNVQKQCSPFSDIKYKIPTTAQ